MIGKQGGGDKLTSIGTLRQDPWGHLGWHLGILDFCFFTAVRLIAVIDVHVDDRQDGTQKVRGFSPHFQFPITLPYFLLNLTY